uniref:Uncharacterized protein n=1 Tax=Rhizophora mucronata TaxID=61149 RepID=A0A2P2M0Q2_RHIMU
MGVASRNLHSPVIEESFPIQQHNLVTRGKNMQLYIDDSINPGTGKPLNNTQMGSSLVNTMQSAQSKAQGKGVVLSGQMTYQPMPPNNPVSRVPSSTMLHGAQRSAAQNQVSPSVQVPGQQLGQHSGSGSQASPPKTPVSTNSYETGEVDSASESSKSKNALVAKGKGSIQGSGRGSFLYGGAQVMGATGNMSVGNGDQNFPGTPAFLPVMQLGGQHPGSMGVPAVGMAFPGYVAQPQLGMGNSEMTWLPLLAGAAGALGPKYCSPYIAVDGAYHARPSGQISSMGPSSKETNNNKPNNEWKLQSQRLEPGSDEFGHRQKPRRYSEMDFKQPSTSA